MVNVKVSLVTISYNSVKTIQQCIDSVASQTYKNVEYIIIDGNSSDGTRDVILKNKAHIHYFKSEEDDGIYDAMNKGIIQATGDVVGLLNADDYFANNNVVSEIAASFSQNNADLLYADLDYVNQNGKVMRRWRSGNYLHRKFNWGWMPPHPTFYAKREMFEHLGLYNSGYGTAADYELMLRFMYLNKAKVFYLNKVIVNMTMGGVSNRNFINRIKAWKCDFRAMTNNHINMPFLSLVLKPLRKVGQFNRLMSRS
ncbi:MAG: glycosyltransferase family 2 protein [Candidatus Pedobacter colombiensis]|uniref:Glycosyltransferase family 2 protein n=1 Tax=Candidatus Pedobacter colombiensis TaxID=3121371 RepID=A0AAJ5W9F0_9SPHI|nr:glycosyltransferase family 2 protein [Pedobacter sp.]WEK19708.1 MAG: glycosyltransferase family 2 protein [Pedobacter sp.]